MRDSEPPSESDRMGAAIDNLKIRLDRKKSMGLTPKQWMLDTDTPRDSELDLLSKQNEIQEIDQIEKEEMIQKHFEYELNQMDEAKRGTKRVRIEALEAENHRMRQQLEDAKKDNVILAEGLRTNMDHLSVKGKEARAFQLELERMRRKIRDLEREKQEIEHKADAMRATAESSVMDLKQKWMANIVEMEELKSKCGDLERDNDILSEQSAKLRKESHAIKAEQVFSNDANDRKQILFDELQTKYKRTRSENMAFAKRLNATLIEMADWKKNNHSMRSAVATESKSMKDRCEALQREKEEAMTKNAMLEQQMNALKRAKGGPMASRTKGRIAEFANVVEAMSKRHEAELQDTKKELVAKINKLQHGMPVDVKVNQPRNNETGEMSKKYKDLQTKYCEALQFLNEIGVADLKRANNTC